MVAKPSPKRGRPALIDRERIVAAAFEIARENGAGAINMTSVAARLGVAQPALYYHVRNVDDLLGLVAAEILRQMPVPDVRMRWDRWLYVFAKELYQLIREHEVLSRVPYLSVHTPFPPTVIERALRVLTRAGFDGAVALLVLSQHIRTVIDLAYANYARAEESLNGRSALRLLREDAKTVPDEQIPTLRAVLDEVADIPDVAENLSSALFEWQVGLELAGLRALLQGAARPPIEVWRLETWLGDQSPPKPRDTPGG
jgi:AcrR family transcriptional regulator